MTEKANLHYHEIIWRVAGGKFFAVLFSFHKLIIMGSLAQTPFSGLPMCICSCHVSNGLQESAHTLIMSG